MKIARVFPRRTRATPTDELAFFDEPGLFPPDVDEVHMSVTFTWDLPKADYLAKCWKHIAPVTIGGPATGQRGEDFTPGKFIKDGYVITSRGCNNKCWFCYVWKRDGKLRELPITHGWNVLDDNLLACSKQHIMDVFAMLKEQPQPIEFTGGLEAAKLEQWHIDELLKLRLKQMFFAYDTPDDLEPLVMAGRMFANAGIDIHTHKLRCYVLIGYPGDTFEKAEHRLYQTIDAGFMPMAMLWRNDSGTTDVYWRRLQREWANAVILGCKLKQHIRGDKRK